MTSKKLFGNRGEETAAGYLKQKSYRIIARNFRIGGREIDLIAEKDGRTILVEVKTRRLNRQADFADSEIPLSRIQSERLKQAVAGYCATNRLSEKQVRLDLILVIADESRGQANLKHYIDII